MISKTPPGGSFRGSFQASLDYLQRGKNGSEPRPLDPGFQASLDYLKHGATESAHDRTDWIATRNLGGVEPELAPRVMRESAAVGNTDKPVYHRIISLAEGEHLSRQQMERVADEVLKGLGLQEHQVLMAQHSDNGKQHVHLIVNRVHPRTGRVWNASHDYAKTERVLRRLEKEMGLQRVPGRHWAEPGQARYQGTREIKEPFARRAQGHAVDILGKAESWQEVHAGLAQHGLSIRPDKRNRGLVVTDGISWAKASSVSRSASRPALEARLGGFEKASPEFDRMMERAQEVRQMAAKADFLRSLRQQTELFRTARSWDELHAALAKKNLRLHASSQGQSLVVTDGRTSVPTFRVSQKMGKKPLERRLGKFEPCGQELPQVPEVTRQLVSRERLERLLSKARHEGLRAKSRMEKVKIAERDLERAKKTFEQTASKVYRDPRSAIRSIRRHERRFGAKKSRLVVAEKPARFGRLRGGRLVGAKERRASIQQAHTHLPYRLHDVERARRFLAKAEEELPRARRAFRRSQRAVARLQRHGSRLEGSAQLARGSRWLISQIGWRASARVVPRPLHRGLRVSTSLVRAGKLPLRRGLARQAEILVTQVGWQAVTRLLPVPQYQALRITLSVARKATLGLARTMGDGP